MRLINLHWLWLPLLNPLLGAIWLSRRPTICIQRGCKILQLHGQRQALIRWVIIVVWILLNSQLLTICRLVLLVLQGFGDVLRDQVLPSPARPLAPKPIGLRLLHRHVVLATSLGVAWEFTLVLAVLLRGHEEVFLAIWRIQLAVVHGVWALNIILFAYVLVFYTLHHYIYFLILAKIWGCLPWPLISIVLLLLIS